MIFNGKFFFQSFGIQRWSGQETTLIVAASIVGDEQIIRIFPRLWNRLKKQDMKIPWDYIELRSLRSMTTV